MNGEKGKPRGITYDTIPEFTFAKWVILAIEIIEPLEGIIGLWIYIYIFIK